MKYIKKILFLFIFLFTFIPNIKAEEKVNLYLFYGDGCPHCAKEKELLNNLQKEYDNLEINTYEVWYDEDNNILLDKVKNAFKNDSKYVPFTVIGTKVYVGFNDNIASQIETAIAYYSKNKARDVVYEVINDIEVGEIKEDKITDVNKFKLPFFGDVNAKEISLPILSVVIGFIDGFNPCAMWVLLFLISMLLGMKDRKRMWILGLTFLTTSALIYLMFMVSWLKIALSISSISYVRILIALVALIGGIVNLYSYFKSDDSGCNVVDDKKRKKMFSKIKKLTSEKSFILALIGVMGLAISVNVVELACSAGLPLIFTQILAINTLNPLQYWFYIFLYILFFLIDDIVVFTIAMVSLKMTGISTKYNKYSHLIGGIIMVIIGILLIFKPGILMFNF